MKASEIMNGFFVEVDALETVLTAAEAMRTEGVGVVCICDENHLPIGVLTDRDVAIRVVAFNRSAQDTRMGSVMTRDLVTCSLETPVTEVERLMKAHSIGRVLIVDEDHRLAGIISLAEIWHHESPLSAGPVSRQVTQRELRAHLTGEQHRPTVTPPRRVRTTDERDA